MEDQYPRYAPGRVRDAIMQVMYLTSKPLSVNEIEKRVCGIIGPAPTSSVRSYLRLNTPERFVREERGLYRIRGSEEVGIQRTLFQTQEW